jgi:hypothetical protein
MVCELSTTARTILTIFQAGRLSHPDTVQQKLAGTVSDHSLLDSEECFNEILLSLFMHLPLYLREEETSESFPDILDL